MRKQAGKDQRGQGQGPSHGTEGHLMRTAADTMLSIRVWAGTEHAGLHFAFKIFPYLEAWRERPVKALEVTLSGVAHASVIAHADVRTWSFTTVMDQTKEFAARGVNTLILHEAFLDWPTQKDAINDELYAWENYLHAHHIDVITIEGYDQGNRHTMRRHFQEISEWRPVWLHFLMDFIVFQSTEGSLLTPVGGDPYFMLDPSVTDIADSEEVKALVGVQTWRFERFARRYPDFQFPFRQMVTHRGTDLVPAYSAHRNCPTAAHSKCTT